MKNTGQKALFLIFILVASAQFSMAQEVYTSSGKTLKQAKKARQARESGFDITRLILGGGATLGFGNYETALGLKPIAGYRFTDHFAAGIGAGYQYYHYKDFFSLPSLTNPNEYSYYSLNANYYSASLWARYLVFRNFFVHAEYEHNFTSYKAPGYEFDQSINNYKLVYNHQGYNVPCLLVGPGVRFGEANRFSYVIMLLYDVLQKENSPYRNYSGGGINYDMRIGININY